jgi:hypothetical protein
MVLNQYLLWHREESAIGTLEIHSKNQSAHKDFYATMSTQKSQLKIQTSTAMLSDGTIIVTNTLNTMFRQQNARTNTLDPTSLPHQPLLEK